MVQPVNSYVLSVSPQKEFTVERILRENGFEVFVPVEWRWRRIRNRFRKREQIARPKLTGYVFLTLPSGPVGLEGILMDRCHVAYLGSGGVPQALPEASMEMVMSMSEKPKPRKKAYNTNCHFRVGEKVRIMDGPFTEHVVDIREIRGKNAVIVLSLFSSEREVIIDLNQLEAA